MGTVGSIAKSTSKVELKSEQELEEETTESISDKLSTEDSETKDEIDVLLYDPKINAKYFGSDENEESVPEVKDVIPIPAKSDDDLKAAKLLIEKFPDLKLNFKLFDSMAIEISKMISSGELDQTIPHLIKLNKISSLNFSKQKQKEALYEYLARINMAQLLFDLYDLLMKEAGIEYLTESIIIKISDTTAIFCIRSIFWNYSQLSLLFGEYLAKTGILNFYIQDLKAMKDDISGPEKLDFIFGSAIGTIHNCAKNPANQHMFHNLDAVTCIIPFLKCDSSRFKVIVLMALAHLVSEDQTKLLMAENEVYRFLLNYIKLAWKSHDHMHDGFSVPGLVAGLKGLAKNDKNKKLLVKIGTLPVLVEILKNGNDAEKKPAVECIWELSFNEENKKIILKDKEVMTELKSLCESKNKNISKAANSALWVLNFEKRERKLEDNGKKKHVMISYAWAEQKTVTRVKEALKRANFHVWMDVDNMGGSTLQAMAEAVENAAVVLICISNSYKQSQNCRLEAEYAVERNKVIIPLKMEQDYKPDGWLGIIKGTKLHFEFSGKYPFEEKIEQLIKELGNRGKTLQAELPTHEEGQTGKETKVTQWSDMDVQKWLEENNLTSNKPLKKLTGKQLQFLKQLKHSAPEFYFGFLQSNLKLRSLEDLMKFSQAVDTLK